MRKIAVLVAILAVAALAAPAFSQTNPFMDVPMNHWAYDAIGQLAAHGILSGYPDGLYKGKQQTTRYEMASALARALAVVDMTKASKQDVEMLKRLVVEFKDELEALGVRVDELDERVALLESRLGGWHIHGILALDLKYQKANEAPTADGVFEFDDAKLWIERFFGEDDQFHFAARFNNDAADGNTKADRFFVEMPFFMDSRFTVGRFSRAIEGKYKVSNNIGNVQTGSWAGDQVMTDWGFTGLGVSKNFALGDVSFIVAHPDGLNGMNVAGMNTNTVNAYRAMGAVANGDGFFNTTYNSWMFLLDGNFQFTEQIGLDIGAQVFVSDNGEPAAPAAANAWAFDKMWTLWGGLRFDFNDNIGFKGIFYHQQRDMNQVNGTGTNWVGVDNDPNHWAVMLDVKQEALKYTSAWLEYGQYDAGFIARSKSSIFYAPTFDFYFAPGDVKYWRVALGQEWNEKWATHLFYYGYKVDLGANREWKPAEYGLGVQYKLNDYTTMGLNYVHVNVDDALNDNDNVVRFRTSVTF
ncbi:MAG: S-layer homology domain-containing protein [Synergistaceae bacterium]|nr:S-layer homology domain-containing protein [Synergistaceae bacterium]